MTGNDVGTCSGPFAYGTAQLVDVAGRKLSRVTENPLPWGPVVQSALRARELESSKERTNKAATKRRKSSTDLVVTTA